ncbi:unnamed protein product [Durusdinium trenchii]|uniref:Poly(A) polymerase n=3 Tax=Durusdinium trenchii TaxID=1381693 RepID=A0ABP0HZ20_9DINO
MSQSSPGASVSSAKLGPAVRYGISDPISLQEAEAHDLVLSERMKEELEMVFPTETPEGMERRQGVLQELERLFHEWMLKQCMEANISEEEIKKSTVKITTLGSYRLGVVHPGSDIDTLCIAPPFVRREDFFSTFATVLDQHEDVSECVPIPDAYTPIIKLKMRGVCIDLLFARLARPPEAEVAEEVAKEDEVLKNMDEKSVRCLNGFRVADQILKLVPNQETFRRTLRFIKYWARRRGIYSNIVGFFGGITWSLLVARICQLYPYYAPNQLVNRFFRLYHQWQWNWAKPVTLCDILEYPATVPGMSAFKVWNPKSNPADRQHVMPVITPAFPSMNSTHNVTETTKRILLDEFKRGFEMVQNVEGNKAEWCDVYAPFPFFQEFKHFLMIEILAKSEDVYNKFSGWVESKLRILVMQLEVVNGMRIHPNPLQYDLLESDGEWPFGCDMFLGLSFTPEAGAHASLQIDLRPALTSFMEVILTWTERDAHLGQFRLRLRRLAASDLPYAADSQPAGLRKRPREASDEKASKMSKSK